MNIPNPEFVAAFSAALTEIYETVEQGKKVNFKQIGATHNLPTYYKYLKQVLQERHLINKECNKWNPNYTIPNERLAISIYQDCRNINAQRQRDYQLNRRNQMIESEPEQKHLSIEETVELVKHYGVFKIIWKCLF